VTLTNTGTDQLTFTSATLGGTNADNFAVPTATNLCLNQTLAIGASCTIGVTFTPLAAADKVATLTLAETGVGSSLATSQVVTLSGTGGGAAGSVTPSGSALPSTVAFGSVQVGTTSAIQTVTLTNTGTDQLVFTSATLGGTNANNFAIVTNLCANQTLAVGASCTIGVTFKPSTAAGKAATLTLTEMGAGSSLSISQVVSLTGTGVAPSASATPTSLAFGSVQVGTTSATQTVTLTNKGIGSLTFTSATLSGDFPNDFAVPVATNLCLNQTLAVGASCTIGVTFTPLSAADKQARLTLRETATGSTLATTQSVSLSGTGTP